jgi:hypothetical protein
MKKTKIPAKKLRLSRETLRSLQVADLQQVAGGSLSDVNSCIEGHWCNLDDGGVITTVC